MHIVILATSLCVAHVFAQGGNDQAIYMPDNVYPRSGGGGNNQINNLLASMHNNRSGSGRRPNRDDGEYSADDIFSVDEMTLPTAPQPPSAGPAVIDDYPTPPRIPPPKVHITNLKINPNAGQVGYGAVNGNSHLARRSGGGNAMGGGIPQPPSPDMAGGGMGGGGGMGSFGGNIMMPPKWALDHLRARMSRPRLPFPRAPVRQAPVPQYNPQQNLQGRISNPNPSLQGRTMTPQQMQAARLAYQRYQYQQQANSQGYAPTQNYAG